MWFGALQSIQCYPVYSGLKGSPVFPVLIVVILFNVSRRNKMVLKYDQALHLRGSAKDSTSSLCDSRH